MRLLNNKHRNFARAYLPAAATPQQRNAGASLSGICGGVADVAAIFRMNAGKTSMRKLRLYLIKYKRHLLKALNYLR